MNSTNHPATVEPEALAAEPDYFALAAQLCPEEFRPAYIHLLRELWKEATEDCATPEIPHRMFRHEILLTITRTPELDPVRLADVYDAMSDHLQEWERGFSEQLRMLSRLRQR